MGDRSASLSKVFLVKIYGRHSAWLRQTTVGYRSEHDAERGFSEVFEAVDWQGHPINRSLNFA